MSQIASFTFIRASDVPFLGFWSKPKPRFLRRPEQQFDQHLAPRTLRDYTCDTDGLYVALSFAWIEHKNPAFARGQDPVTGTLVRNLGGAHWVIRPQDREFLGVLAKPMEQAEWELTVPRLAQESYDQLNPDAFEESRAFIAARISELGTDEALLVSVG